MLKLEPYFHIGGTELIHAIAEFFNTSYGKVEEDFCYWLNIDSNLTTIRDTILVHTNYEELMKYSDYTRKAVELIQKDNCNVLAFGEVFCIEF